MPATSQSPERDGDASVAPPGLVPGLRWRRVFPGDERQLAALRRWLAFLLPQCPARDDVTAVASELGANAIKHTASGRGGWFAVEVTWHGPVVRVAVADSGGPNEPRVIGDLASEDGRGLLLVRGLSVRTGACGDHRGRLIWADVAWEGFSPAAATLDGYEAAIRDGQATLARRFTGVPAWFGRATLAWWALAGPAGLVTAPTARELAGLLCRLLDVPPPLRADPARDHREIATGINPDAAAGAADPDGRDSPGISPGTPGGSNGPARVAAGGPLPALVPVLAPAAAPSLSHA